MNDTNTKRPGATYQLVVDFDTMITLEMALAERRTYVTRRLDQSPAGTSRHGYWLAQRALVDAAVAVLMDTMPMSEVTG